jgi:ArsR family transcriptional regulator, arsenate/arsenite/antimonite-responsive transcriptional repressor / arsenate reductase (thioredoxin)
VNLEVRAARHAALGDPLRLAIVEELARSDRTPSQLRHTFSLESNLLAHHLKVLADCGLVARRASDGDGRRRYVTLDHAALGSLAAPRNPQPGPALFVCTRNSARSQLGAALWSSLTGNRAESAGTEPAEAVHPGAVAAARRAGLDLGAARPRRLPGARRRPPTVVTVCDHAYEALDSPVEWLHWSIPDPVVLGTARAFDRTVERLRARILALAAGGLQ